MGTTAAPGSSASGQDMSIPEARLVLEPTDGEHRRSSKRPVSVATA
jgi:hypothetical protein